MNVNNVFFHEFVTLADVKNFTRAAEVCGTTQSSLSRHLQELERWAGKPLVQRNAHPIALTAAGELVLKHARAALAQRDALRSELEELGGPAPLRISIPYLLATTRLASWLDAWTGDARSSLSVRTGSIIDCIRDLDARKVDLAVCYELHDDKMRLDGRRFERVVLNREVIRPYASNRLIESGRATFPGSLRRPMSFITYTPESFFARAMRQACAQAHQGLQAVSLLEIQLSDVQADLAEGDLGVSWLSDSTLKRSSRSSLIALGAGKWDVPVEVVAYRVKGSAHRSKSDIWERIRSTADSF